uniref:Uncharacterized protein n=1 Tax=Heterorhabditis bacteriophora TaxID=37862 RepID=A0A1I7WDA1_HETBA
MNRFQGVRSLTREENSSSVSKRRYRSSNALPATISMSALENINSIPFRYPREKKLLPLDDTSILGSTDPHSTTVHSSRIELKYLLLPPRSLQPGLRPKTFNATTTTLLLVTPSHKPVTAGYRSFAQAPSIFRAIVTHSLAGTDFHGHRPAVYINQRLLWGLMREKLGTLTQRLVHPTAPVLLTKNGPLGAHVHVNSSIKKPRHHTH